MTDRYQDTIDRLNSHLGIEFDVAGKEFPSSVSSCSSGYRIVVELPTYREDSKHKAWCIFGFSAGSNIQGECVHSCPVLAAMGAVAVARSMANEIHTATHRTYWALKRNIDGAV